MAALITIADIEVALGREVEDAQEEAQWQHVIDTVSARINNVVDYSFELIEDDTRRLRAEWDGELRLPGLPVVSITSVTNYRTGMVDFYADFDGIDTIFNLAPNEVVDVVWSYGYDEVPADIQQLCVDVCLNVIGEDAPVTLRSFQVGDVKEEYRDSQISSLVGTLGSEVLAKYMKTGYTIRASGRQYPDYQSQGYLNDFD